MQVSTDVLEVLDRASVVGSSVILNGTLDRKLYERTNKVLEAAGGTWNRKAKAHLFEGDAAELLEPVLLTGHVVAAKQEFGQFYTPAGLADRIIALAELHPGMSVLEPSAGRGALAAPALISGCDVTCVEIDPRNVSILCSTNFRGVVQGDFLEQKARPVFDRVVMNPPFAARADIHHVAHAMRCLKPGGKLIAIMSSGVLFRSDLLTANFRQTLREAGGTIDPLPDGSFKEAGTLVSTVLVTLRTAEGA